MYEVATEYESIDWDQQNPSQKGKLTEGLLAQAISQRSCRFHIERRTSS